MESTKLNLTIYGKEVSTKEGNKFPVFSTKINDEYFKIAFTRECVNSPRSAGVYELTVDFRYINEVKSSYISDKTGKRGCSTLWVKNVDTIRKKTQEELELENLARNTVRFGSKTPTKMEDIPTDEDLPF